MPWFSRADAIAFDRHAQDVLGVPGIVLMENAALGCIAVLRQHMGPAWPRVRVEIVCGRGNNGGDGYAIARQCLVEGAQPRLRPVGVPRAGSDAEINARICAALHIPSIPFAGRISDEPLDGEVVVDALFGTGLDREVDEESARVIAAINRFGGQIISIDLPSGLDADSGEPLGIAVHADATCTMVEMKRGFQHPDAAIFTGRIEVISIGVPSPSRVDPVA